MTSEAAVIAAYKEMRQDGVGYRAPSEENDAIEHIDARFDQLEQKVEGEVSDLFRVLYAFRYGETPAAEWDAGVGDRTQLGLADALTTWFGPLLTRRRRQGP
jgi:hypothetical protein